MIEISDGEANSLRDFVRSELIESIRRDPELDSLLYLWNILSFYERTGGFKEDGYIDYCNEFNNR